jgi:hypothetical protein
VSENTDNLLSTDILTSVLPIGTTRAAISPLTHMAAYRARTLAADDISLATAVDISNIGVAQQYNLYDIVGTLPVDANNTTQIEVSSREQRNYGLVLAGIAQEATDLDVRPIDLAVALATDMEDGTLDGLGQNPISVPTISGPVITLPSTAGTSDLQNAISIFLGSNNNRTNLAGMNISTAPVNVNPAGGTFYIAATALPVWHPGQAGTATILIKGGTPPYICAVTPGSQLPSGMTLSQQGGTGGDWVLTWTPPLLAGGSTMSITPPFSVTCTDKNGLSQAIQWTATTVPPPPVVTPAAALSCTAGEVVNLPLGTASGGTPPYHYFSDTFASNPPPLGMIVDLNGNLKGTCPAAGTNATIRICAADLIGAENCANAVLTSNPAQQPTGGDGYSGTWSGTFNYTARWFPAPDYTEHIANGSFTLTMTLSNLASAGGSQILYVKSVTCSDPAFGSTSAEADYSNMATLPLPYNTTPTIGQGILITFPNGSFIGTSNSVDGSFTVSADGRTISSSAAVSSEAFTASTSVGDSNTPGSGPGGYAYNWCTFNSWSLTKQ